MAVNVNDFATIGHLGQLATKTAGELAKTFKSLKVSENGNSVSFFASKDGTGEPLATFDFAEEIFLDQAGTTLVESFTWSAETYPNSTNPNLEGKPVFVLCVKGDKETNPTVKYSFVSLEKLGVKVSAETGNALETKSDGLYVKDLKVANATEGNVPQLNSDGTLANSTVPVADIVTKVSDGTTGNIVALDANGKIVDSGHGVATDEDVTAYLNEIFA